MRPLETAGFIEHFGPSYNEINKFPNIGIELEVKNNPSCLEWPISENLSIPSYTGCHFFASGTCIRGNDCPFQHFTQTCHFYELGKCAKGKKCPFSHAPQNGADVTLTSQVSLAHPHPQNVFLEKNFLNGERSSVVHLPNLETVVPTISSVTSLDQFQSNLYGNTRCSNGSRSYTLASQTPPNLSSQVCHFFVNGVCSKGDACSYVHISQDLPSIATPIQYAATSVTPEPCRFFTKGRCTKGEQCPFTHDSKLNLEVTDVNSPVPPNPNTCRFYNKGCCTKGERCTYVHDSQLSTILEPKLNNTPSPDSKKVQCHYYFQGFCSMGESCQFAHSPQSQSLTSPPESLPEILPTPEPCRFFSKGHCSKGESCPYKHEGFDISITPTANVESGQVRRHVFGTQVAIFGPGVTVVSVLPSAANQRKQTGEIRSRALKVEWNPSSIMHMNFEKYTDAQYIASSCDGLVFKGRSIKCSVKMLTLYRSRKKPVIRGVVSVSGVTSGVTSAELRSFMNVPADFTCKINMEPVSYEEDDAPSAIKSALEKHGTLDSFEIQPGNEESFKRGAIAKFSSADGATRAVAYLSVNKKGPLEGLKLTFTPLYSAKFSVPYDLYKLKVEEIELVMKSHRPRKKEKRTGGLSSGVTVELINANPSCLVSTTVTILLHSSDPRVMARAKKGFELVLEGERVTRTSGEVTLAAWNDIFGKPRGTGFFRNLGQETGTFIYRDVRRKELRVHGSANACNAAIGRIRSFLVDLEAKQHVLQVPSAVLHHLIRSESLKSRVASYGARNVILQLVPPTLVVEGESEVVAHIKAFLGRMVAEDLETCEDKSTTAPCPICFHDVDTQNVCLDCGHRYCKDCFTVMAAQSLQLGAAVHFPIECVKENCRQRIGLHALESVLSTDQQRALHETALEYHVNSHPERYQWCITPDCRGVYVVASSYLDRVALCGSCDVEVCTACHVEEHRGISCTENQSIKNEDIAMRCSANGRRHLTHSLS